MNPRDFVSPRQLAAAIGVSESSLKRWTDKGLLHVSRTVGGHRRISFPAVIEFIRSTGTPIVDPELIGLNSDLKNNAFDPEKSQATLFTALRNGDTRASSAVAIHAFLTGIDMAGICDDLIGPAMAAIGEACKRGDFDLYVEHRATQICAGVLHELRRLLSDPAPDAPVAIGAAPAGDPCLLATGMVELVLTQLGWRAWSLGPDTPLVSVAHAAQSENAKLIWLSVSVNGNGRFPRDELSRLVAQSKRNGAMIVVGGGEANSELCAATGATLAGPTLAELSRVAVAPPMPSMTDAADLIGL